MQDSRSRIELFGGIRLLRENGETAKFRTQKTAALLAYLALFPRRMHTREQIADLFWPDQIPADGRNNLSTALTALRRLLEPTGIASGSVLQTDRIYIGLNNLAVSTDAQEFERILDAVAKTQTEAEQRSLLSQAFILYRGDLAEGHYDDWIFSERTRLRERWLTAMQRYLALLEQASAWESALEVSSRLLTEEPTLEAAAQVKMRALAYVGRSAAVQETYRTLENRLRDELDAAPLPETRQLAAALSKAPPATEMPFRQPTLAARPIEIEIALPPASSSASRAALPLRLTRFFGREAELQRLCDWLQTGCEAPGSSRTARRLITLTGPGGAGKTRLALETAEQAAESFKGRVWFVSLENTPDARLLPFAVVHALGLNASAAQDPLQQIADALGETPSLLALDNFEHLLQNEPEADKCGSPAPLAAQFARLLLERVPTLHLLITSRRALGLSGEQEFPLAPLRVPSDTETLESLRTCDSVALYLDRAILAYPDFVLTARNAPTVAALCRRLEGMPLALEIAAAWVKTLPPARMLARLETQLITLESRRRDLPPRQRSLRAVIEWSHQLLPPELRDAFARLSVFRGGWTLEAASAVCGLDAEDYLEALREHSLVVMEEGETPRCHFMETVREFAAEQISMEAHRETARRHALYFAKVAALAHEETAPDGESPLLPLALDYENLQSALEWAAQNDLLIAMEMAANLGHFWSHHGYWQAGEQWLKTILARCAAELEASDAAPQRWRLTRERAKFAGWRGDYDLAETLYQASLIWSEKHGSDEDIAASWQGLGFVAARRGAMREAIAHLSRALERWRSLNRPHEVRNGLLWLAHAAEESENEAQAEAHYAEALEMARKAGDKSDIAVALNGLGERAYRREDYTRAELLKTEALALCRETGLKRFKGYCLLTLADILRRRGEFTRAETLLMEGLLTFRDLGERGILSAGVACCALLWKAQKKYKPATQLLAALTRLRNGQPTTFPAGYDTEASAALAEARSALGVKAFERQFETGREMTLEQTVELTLTQGHDAP